MDRNRENKMTVKLVTNDKIAETSSKGNQEKWFEKQTNGTSSTNSATKHCPK